MSIQNISKIKIVRSYIPSYRLRSRSGSNVCAYSYLPHAGSLYNRLPDNIKSAASLAHFKIPLKAHICYISILCVYNYYYFIIILLFYYIYNY